MNVDFIPVPDVRVGDELTAGVVVQVIDKPSRKTVTIVCEHDGRTFSENRRRDGRVAVISRSGPKPLVLCDECGLGVCDLDVSGIHICDECAIRWAQKAKERGR